MIIAIVRDMDNDNVSTALTNEGLRVTYVASTGGFLRRGQSTLLIGLEDELVENALNIIRKNVTPASESDERHSIIFVLNVENYTQF